MKIYGITLNAGLAAALLVTRLAVAEGSGEAPKFQEVLGLISANLAGVTEPDLNREAVQALVAAFSPRVMLFQKAATNAEGVVGLVSKSTRFEGPIGYIQVGSVAEGLEGAVRQAYGELDGTNQIKGLVLDLRYAGGDDYAAAAATAELFVKKDRPLLNWGQGMYRAKEKSDLITIPVAVLVNGETHASAEALAAVLRETGAGLILGGKTAGQAMITSDFKLSSGQILRIATAPIQLGDGATLTGGAVKPDIAVEVSPQEERVWYADAFKPHSRTNVASTGTLAATNSPAGTNRVARRPRFNEAELVRERRQGPAPEPDPTSFHSAEPEKPTVADPVLARALDVLKGLAVVRQSRAS
jgi:hypothetical protein